MEHKKGQTNGSHPAPLAWFTQSTFRYTPLIAELMVVAVVIRLLGLVEPFVFQAIIDRVLPFQREATLALIVVVLALVTLSMAVLQALSAYLGNHMGNCLVAEMGGRIFRHVLGLPLQSMQRWQVGETLARMEEIDTVRGFLTGTVSGYVLDVLFAITYIAALALISPFLTLIVMIMLPLQILAFGTIGPFVRRRMQASFLAGARHQSRLVETFANLITVKALASEQRQAERFRETLDESLVSGFRVSKLHIVNGFVGHLLESGSVILILYYGSSMVLENEITLGQLVAFHLLAEKVSGPILSLSSIWEQWQGIRIARLRLGDFLNRPMETEPAKPPLCVGGPLRLSLDKVCFGYLPDRRVIQNISLSIEPDRPTLILGDSGTGKSTLAKLICGLYMPDSGTIAANGQNLGEYDPHSVRRTIAYLPQDPVLFSGTVIDNLLIANPDATEEEILRALSDSAADRVVEQLADGLQADVGERGSYLSGGQRQRIALARALLTDAKAFVLDEPTSALDAEAAAVIVSALQLMARNRTLIVITHNPDLLGADVNLFDITRQQPEQACAAVPE